MGFADSRPDYDHYAAIDAAIAADPGVFANDAERADFEAKVKGYLDSAKDPNTKLKIVGVVEAAIKGGLAGGAGGIPGILAGIASAFFA